MTWRRNVEAEMHGPYMGTVKRMANDRKKWRVVLLPYILAVIFGSKYFFKVDELKTLLNAFFLYSILHTCTIPVFTKHVTTVIFR